MRLGFFSAFVILFCSQVFASGFNDLQSKGINTYQCTLTLVHLDSQTNISKGPGEVTAGKLIFAKDNQEATKIYLSGIGNLFLTKIFNESQLVIMENEKQVSQVNQINCDITN